MDLPGGKLTKTASGRWQLSGFEIRHREIFEIYAFGHWLAGSLDQPANSEGTFVCPETEAAIILKPGMGARLRTRYFDQS